MSAAYTLSAREYISNTSLDAAQVKKAVISNPIIIESVVPGGFWNKPQTIYKAGAIWGGDGQSFCYYANKAYWKENNAGDVKNKGEGDIFDLVGEIFNITNFRDAVAKVAELWGYGPKTLAEGESDAAKVLVDALRYDLDAEESRPIRSRSRFDDLPVRESKTLPEIPRNQIDWNNPTYIYTYFQLDDRGNRKPVFYVCRWEKEGYRKMIRPVAKYGPKGPVFSMDGVERVPYNLYGDRVAGTKGVTQSPYVLFVEGEKCADTLIDLGFCASTVQGGCNGWQDSFAEYFRDKDIYIIPDQDASGEHFAETVANGLSGVAKTVKVCWLPGLEYQGDDVVNWLQVQGNDKERLLALLNDAPYWKNTVLYKEIDINIEEYVTMDVPQREYIMYPILPVKGISMLYAFRGIGKSYFACSVAYAAACGTSLVTLEDGPSWYADKPRKVLYLDGEMSVIDMQDRLKMLMSCDKKPEKGYFRIISYDRLPVDQPTPNLTTEEGQKWLEDNLKDAELLVLDNVATLFGRKQENTAESWRPIQDWLLSLRRRGVTVLLVHHAGKNGDQRDTSAKEDIVNLSIRLRRPQDYMPEDGARFIVELTKARGICGNEAKPFEMTLSTVNGKIEWLSRLVEDDCMQAVISMSRDGKSERAIAHELGISDSKVHRLRMKAKKEGKL